MRGPVFLEWDFVRHVVVARRGAELGLLGLHFRLRGFRGPLARKYFLENKSDVRMGISLLG
jgi:hypothetical protein